MSRKSRNHQPIKQAQLDVCILTVGRYDYLTKCLDALYREAQLIPLNIYIVDNGGSAKEHLDHLDLFQYRPEKDPAGNIVKYQTKCLQQNIGFPAGSNEAARMGSAPLVMFLGDDVELKPGAIESVVSRFQDQTVGVVGIKLLFPLDSTSPLRPAGKVQHVGLGVNIRGEPFHPLVAWSAAHPKTCISRDVWAVTGACFTIRRNLFHKFGGFNPAYGLGTHEDLELCMQTRQAGFRVYLDAVAQGYHYVGASAEKLNVAFPLQQNRNIFMSRWAQSGLVFWSEAEWW